MKQVIRPAMALDLYRSNVEQFTTAAPLLLFIGDEKIKTGLVIGNFDTTNIGDRFSQVQAPFPLRQAILSIEALVADREDNVTRDSVVIYSAGDEEFMLVAPFVRKGESITWLDRLRETSREPLIDSEPAVAALREIVERSRA